LWSPPHVSDPLDTLKEPPLTEAVVVPRMMPPGMPLLTTATGSVTAQPAGASADAIRTKRRIAIPPAAFVVIVRRAGVVRQPDATSSSYLVREVRGELERNLIRFVRVLWPVKWTAKPQSLRKNLV
jgi:hypothetical protein